MKTSRFTDNQIIAVLKQAETGTPVPVSPSRKLDPGIFRGLRAN